MPRLYWVTSVVDANSVLFKLLCNLPIYSTVVPILTNFYDIQELNNSPQYIIITVCFKAGFPATETLILVKRAYGNGAVNRSTFLYGILDFEKERTW
jgi:hypothetical protein